MKGLVIQEMFTEQGERYWLLYLLGNEQQFDTFTDLTEYLKQAEVI